MPKSDFIFGSFDTGDYGGAFFKLQPINFPTPEKDTVSFEVPGRSGDLLIDYGSYKNVELTVEIGIDGEAVNGDFLTLYDTLRAAVMVQRGYQRLEDSFYPDEYRQARAVNVERDQSDTVSGKAIITFDAKPQRYLKSGETAVISIDPATTSLQNLIGIGTDLFNDDFKNIITGQGFPVGVEYMAVNITDYASGGYSLKLTYPAGTVPVKDGLYMPVGAAMNPFAGESYQFGYIANEFLSTDNTITHTTTGGGPWAVFMTPLKAEIYQGSTKVASILPESTVITPPLDNLSYTPLIHLTVSGAVKSGVVLMLDENKIGLDTPATIGNLPITDIYIDIETFNAYAISNGAVISLNNYVTLTGEFIFNGPITVYSNANFVTCEIMPRWWII